MEPWKGTPKPAIAGNKPAMTARKPSTSSAKPAGGSCCQPSSTAKKPTTKKYPQKPSRPAIGRQAQHSLRLPARSGAGEPAPAPD